MPTDPVIYLGPWADDTEPYDHDGYPGKLLDDGRNTLKRTWGGGFARYRGACVCGWVAERTRPATDEGRAAALTDWDADHLQPVLDRWTATWPVWHDDIVSLAGKAQLQVSAGNYAAAARIMHRLGLMVARRERHVSDLHAADTYAERRAAADAINDPHD